MKATNNSAQDKPIYFHLLKCQLGQVLVVATEKGVSRIDFQDGPRRQELSANWQPFPTHYEHIIAQLTAYFSGTRTAFDFDIDLQGTTFQKSVWKALQTIPFGEMRNYSEVAKMIGNERAVRAVASANANNPISIVVPCHRVIGKDGELRGYAGGLDKKAALLSLEGRLEFR